MFVQFCLQQLHVLLEAHLYVYNVFDISSLTACTADSLIARKTAMKLKTFIIEVCMGMDMTEYVPTCSVRFLLQWKYTNVDQNENLLEIGINMMRTGGSESHDIIVVHL